jgi:hypothetical protein
MWYKTEDLNKDIYLDAKEHVKPMKTKVWLDTVGATDCKKHTKTKHHERRMGGIHKDSL